MVRLVNLRVEDIKPDEAMEDDLIQLDYSLDVNTTEPIDYVLVRGIETLTGAVYVYRYLATLPIGTYKNNYTDYFVMPNRDLNLALEVLISEPARPQVIPEMLLDKENVTVYLSGDGIITRPYPYGYGSSEVGRALASGQPLVVTGLVGETSESSSLPLAVLVGGLSLALVGIYLISRK